MKHAADSECDTHDPILSLLSEDELARLSTSERAPPGLVDGDEYIDLGAPYNGVRRVHMTLQQTMGKALPRSAVSTQTWLRIAERFGTRFAAKTAG